MNITSGWTMAVIAVAALVQPATHHSYSRSQQEMLGADFSLARVRQPASSAFAIRPGHNHSIGLASKSQARRIIRP